MCWLFPADPLEAWLAGNSLRTLRPVYPTSEGKKKSSGSARTCLVLNLPCEGLEETAVAGCVECLVTLKATEQAGSRGSFVQRLVV